MKNVVLEKDDMQRIAPVFRGKWGERLLKVIVPLLAIDKVNAIYGRCCHKRGYEFSSLLLKDLDITYEVTNPEMLKMIPREGAFITVSNHPYGALDGITLISFMGEQRPDFKVMVNSILTYIDAMSPNFIAVEPYSSKKGSVVNMKGIKDSLRHLKEGHPLGFFPAGGVSGLNSGLKIEDNVWAENIIRLISQMKVPVIPVYFHGRNSLFFYALGVVSWKIRTLRLAPEVFRARGRKIRISIGDPVSVEKQQSFSSLSELGEYLRSCTYEAGRTKR
ncbi:MAG: lysophospholipid acyltransferase family protein [Bacteroidales bacterium]